MPCVDGIEIFSVKLVDGFTKSLCVQAIFALLHKLDCWIAHSTTSVAAFLFCSVCDISFSSHART